MTVRKTSSPRCGRAELGGSGMGRRLAAGVASGHDSIWRGEGEKGSPDGPCVRSSPAGISPLVGEGPTLGRAPLPAPLFQHQTA